MNQKMLDEKFDQEQTLSNIIQHDFFLLFSFFSKFWNLSNASNVSSNIENFRCWMQCWMHLRRLKVLFCEYCRTFQITCFEEHLLLATSIRCFFDTISLKHSGFCTTYYLKILVWERKYKNKLKNRNLKINK